MGQLFGGPPASDNTTVEYNSQARLRIKDDGVDAAKLKDDATTDANRAVTTNHIRDAAVVEAKIGTAAVTEAKIGAAAVAQGKLKTAIGEVSSGSVAAWNPITLPGGEYGFYPQTKMSSIASQAWAATIAGTAGLDSGAGWTSYVTNINLRNGGSGIMYAQQRYVTASGKDHWIFLLIDKATGDVIAGYSAPDHPMYGNGGDINLVPHPFRAMDLTGKEVVILGKSDIAALKAKVTKDDSILTIIHRDHKIDVLQQLPYQPLHSGEFIDKNPVLITNLPTGITVKKLKAKI